VTGKLKADYEKQLSDYKKRLVAFEAKWNKFQTEKANSENEKKQYEVQLRNYSKQINSLEADLKSTKATIDKLKADYENRLTTYKSKVGELETSVDASLKKANSLKTKYEGKISKYVTKINTLSSKYDVDFQGFRAKISTLEKQLSACNTQIKSIQSNYKLEIKNWKSKYAGMSTQYDRMMSKFAALEKVHSKCVKASSIYDPIQDNLQVIEGIGPKMEALLKKNGVTTWKKLASLKPKTIKGWLDAAGGRYRIIDPTTWPLQAGLADVGDWKKLIKHQKEFDTGRVVKDGHLTDAKIEKMFYKLKIWNVEKSRKVAPKKVAKKVTKKVVKKVAKKGTPDDLKKVEGIGPKIEGLLNAAGIMTWAQLSKTSIKKINAILDAAGPRYRMASPGTWPVRYVNPVNTVKNKTKSKKPHADNLGLYPINNVNPKTISNTIIVMDRPTEYCSI